MMSRSLARRSSELHCTHTPCSHPCTGFPKSLTIFLATSDKELQDLVHGTHVEDDPKLGHAHGDEAPQENGGAEALAKKDRL